jgi:hypothetical protein
VSSSSTVATLATVSWSTIANLATATGTLVLAVATFSAVRSGQRSARVAERALQLGLRPVLIPARPEDPPERVIFGDGRHWDVPGGEGVAAAEGDVVYFAIPLRNVGTGLALLHGWYVLVGQPPLEDVPCGLDRFRRLTRDLYVAPGDRGYWQGALRDPTEPIHAGAGEAVRARDTPITVYLLYGDFEGGQRSIGRYSLRFDEEVWLATSSRFWPVDTPPPR